MTDRYVTVSQLAEDYGVVPDHLRRLDRRPTEYVGDGGQPLWLRAEIDALTDGPRHGGGRMTATARAIPGGPEIRSRNLPWARTGPDPTTTASKEPGYPGWQQLYLTADSLDQHFPAKLARNIGILNGAPSGNILDVDLDCPEALRAAPLLLPPTGWIFGRKSAPRSHWIYQCDIALSSAAGEVHGP